MKKQLELKILEIKLTKKQIEKIKRVFFDQLMNDYMNGSPGFLIAEPMIHSRVLKVAYLPIEPGKKVVKILHSEEVVNINDNLLKESL